MEKIGIYAMAALWLSLSALLFAPQAAAADGLEWFYDDSGRAGETKWIDTFADADGIETFGFAWKISNGISSFRTIPGGLRIIIR